MLHRVLYGARHRLKLTLQAVADRTGLTVPYLSMMEHGKRTPATSKLPILGEVLDIPSDELLSAVAADHKSRTKRQKDRPLTRP